MLFRQLAVAALCIVISLAPAQGQQAPDRVAFEAASVKINSSDRIGIMRRPTPGRVYFENTPLEQLIEEAYVVRPGHISGLPRWGTTERFDVVATYDANMAAQVPRMLQALLEDRFFLRVHRETREMPVYELMKARSDGTLGPGLRPSTTNCTAPPGERSPCTLRIASNSIQGTGVRWGFLPPNIGVWDRPIIDKTGLTGRFDVTLDWTPDPALARSPEGAAAAAASPTSGDHVSIFTAVQEQLGLRLQPARGPVEVLVIDSVERPTPD